MNLFILKNELLIDYLSSSSHYPAQLRTVESSGLRTCESGSMEGQSVWRNISLLAAGLLLSGCNLLASNPEQELDDVFVGVNYVGVVVDDLDSASSLYQSAFEVSVIVDEPLDLAAWPAAIVPNGAVEARSALIRSSNAQLRLMSFESEMSGDAVGVTGPGIAHVCFQAVDTTQPYAKALAAGAQPIGAEELVALSSRNPVKYGYITDPLGTITEVEEVDITQLDLPEPPKNTHRMRHVAFATPDLDTLTKFYSSLLGGQEPRRIGHWIRISGDNVDKVSGLEGSEIEMAWFQLRNLEIEIAQFHSHRTERASAPRPFNAPGYNIIMFDVTDLAKARQRVTDAGGTIVGESPSLDGAVTIFARDPDGNLIGFQQLPESSIYSAKNFDGNGT